MEIIKFIYGNANFNITDNGRLILVGLTLFALMLSLNFAIY